MTAEDVKSAVASDSFMKFLMAIMTAITLGTGALVWGNSIKLATLTEAVAAAGKDRYTGTQARGDIGLILQRLDTLEREREDVIQRIRVLERGRQP